LACSTPQSKKSKSIWKNRLRAPTKRKDKTAASGQNNQQNGSEGLLFSGATKAMPKTIFAPEVVLRVLHHHSETMHRIPPLRSESQIIAGKRTGDNWSPPHNLFPADHGPRRQSIGCPQRKGGAQ
jgi:hypothetical protein